MRRRELLLLVGGAVTAPHALRADQKALPVIGYLGGASPAPFTPFVSAFLQGLSETGYVEGQNLAIESRDDGDTRPPRAAEGNADDRLPLQRLAHCVVYGRVPVGRGSL